MNTTIEVGNAIMYVTDNSMCAAKITKVRSLSVYQDRICFTNGVIISYYEFYEGIKNGLYKIIESPTVRFNAEIKKIK